VDVDGQLLTIRAERTAGLHDSVKWLSQERPFGSYLRQFSQRELRQRRAHHEPVCV
jgi:HSP20 family protein